MNKAIQKLMMALAVCGALCGSAMAAPKGNPPPKGKAPVAMRANAPKGHTVKAHAPARHDSRHAAKPPKHDTRHKVAHHKAPPPPPRHHEPKHHHHHNNTLHTEDWCVMGASLLGGVIGGIVVTAPCG